jgi:hypothetical protein
MQASYRVLVRQPLSVMLDAELRLAELKIQNTKCIIFARPMQSSRTKQLEMGGSLFTIELYDDYHTDESRHIAEFLLSRWCTNQKSRLLTQLFLKDR